MQALPGLHMSGRISSGCILLPALLTGTGAVLCWSNPSLHASAATDPAAACACTAAIACNTACLHCCIRLQMRREYLRTANELQRMLLMLHTRSRAATSIQSAWRGWRQRQLFLPVWRQYQEQKAALVLQRVSGAG